MKTNLEITITVIIALVIVAAMSMGASVSDKVVLDLGIWLIGVMVVFGTLGYIPRTQTIGGIGMLLVLQVFLGVFSFWFPGLFKYFFNGGWPGQPTYLLVMSWMVGLFFVGIWLMSIHLMVALTEGYKDIMDLNKPLFSDESHRRWADAADAAWKYRIWTPVPEWVRFANSIIGCSGRSQWCYDYLLVETPWENELSRLLAERGFLVNVQIGYLLVGPSGHGLPDPYMGEPMIEQI